MRYGPEAEPYEDYPEVAHLRVETMAVSASVEDSAAQYPELARTKSARYVQAYIHGGDEASWQLLSEQQTRGRLTFETYQELSELSREAMPDADAYLAVGFGNTIHDVFKNTNLLPEVGLSSEANHDDALRRLFRPEYRQARLEHFPSLESGEFTSRQLRLIEGMLQGDFIRFVQSQASEAEITALAELPRDILLCTIMHGIHDLGGAMGHKNEKTSLTLDEPAAVRLLDAAHALLTPPEELGLPADTPITPFARRFLYMHLRAWRLGVTNDMTKPMPEMPAKLAVADMLRCYSAEDFATAQAAFQRLPLLLRTNLAWTHALPIQYPEDAGDTRPPGLGAEYAPAFLRSFGKDESALYLALGCFTQIHLESRNIPLQTGNLQDFDLPVDAPYQKINFYHVAKALKQNPPTVAQPVWLDYTYEDGLLAPKVVPHGYQGTHVKKLFHPDVYRDSRAE